mgnify:CR=1 FL=1|jgi:hypothetical protein
MKTVGHRHEQPLQLHAAGELLAEGARFSEAVHALSRMCFVPKGIRRFPTHQAANQDWDICLAKGMARLAAARVR